jgi:hypothetical protein
MKKKITSLFKWAFYAAILTILIVIILSTLSLWIYHVTKSQVIVTQILIFLLLFNGLANMLIALAYAHLATLSQRRTLRFSAIVYSIAISISTIYACASLVLRERYTFFSYGTTLDNIVLGLLGIFIGLQLLDLSKQYGRTLKTLGILYVIDGVVLASVVFSVLSPISSVFLNAYEILFFFQLMKLKFLKTNS